MNFCVFHKILKLMSIICILGVGTLSYALDLDQDETAETLSTGAAESADNTDATSSEETAVESADNADTTSSEETAVESADNADATSSEGEENSCGSVQIIEKLQLEWSNQDEKGMLLDQFAELEGEDLQKCLCTNTDKELMAVTIMDISRHTHAGLAQKAKTLVELFDPMACVNEMLNSADPHRYENIVMFLLRIEPDQAKGIFDKASFAEDDSQDKLYMEKIIFEGFIPHLMPAMLIPTASEEGDRYYVKTEWDPNNEEQFNCLSELFKGTVLAKRSGEQEKEWMKKLNGTRWVYWYSKEWAIGLAQGVTQCGGKASFVKGPNS